MSKEQYEDLGVDSFKKQEAIDNPKKIINRYINSAKGSADVQDAKEYIALIAKVGNHSEKELYDYFVAQMQHWGRGFPSKRKSA